MENNLQYYFNIITSDSKNATVEQALEVSKFLKETTIAYDEGKPIVDDIFWDEMYFWLLEWQKNHKGVIDDSCGDIIYFQKISKLNKVEHNHPMLSLAKTKDLEEIKAFCGDKDCIAMLKMDGLTCSLYYEDGKLIRAETRGNGLIGEDITHNAMVIPSIPKKIDYHYPLVVDGEVICKYDDFEPFATQYKNPRNFAAGSIRLLDAKESYNRHLTFVAWDAPIAHSVIYAKNKQGIKLMFWDEGEINTLSKKLQCLNELGFEVVPWSVVDLFDIEFLKTFAKENKYPIDGLVYKYNNCDYYNSLGRTDHHFKGGIAYKFYDEVYETVLCDIEWTMGRTGVLTPVAIFDQVDTGDSIVTRANLHNISIMEELYPHQWCTGMKLEIYLANMIIPQVKSVTVPEAPAYRLDPPKICPICGAETEIRKLNDSKELICTNPECQGKLINRLDHFCSKKGLDIKGLSKATLEKLIDWNYVSTLSDIYKLSIWQDEWKKKPGFGEKSVDNILMAIEQSKSTTTLDKFIAAIGIPLIGNTVAKEIIKHVFTYEDFRDMVIDHYPFYQWDGFAEAKCDSLWKFDYTEADEVYQFLNIQKIEPTETKNDLGGKVFVITGRLAAYANREALKKVIEEHGGKVASAISGNTSYLINNDINSSSAKNKAAKEKNIPIITEEEFNQMV